MVTVCSRKSVTQIECESLVCLCLPFQCQLLGAGCYYCILVEVLIILAFQSEILLTTYVIVSMLEKQRIMCKRCIIYGCNV